MEDIEKEKLGGEIGKATVYKDASGYIISQCPSQSVCDSINNFVRHLLEYQRMTKQDAKEIEEAECPLAQIFCLISKIIHAEGGHSELIGRIEELFGRMETTEREELLFYSVIAWSRGEIADALEYHQKIIRNFPKCLVNIFLGFNHFIYLYNVNNVVSFLKLAQKELGDNGYYCGMLCFALGENQEYQEALEYGQRSMKLNSTASWTHHAMSHIYQDLGQESEGIEFMEENFKHWNHCIPFMKSHNWWHLAMLYLHKYASNSKEMTKVQQMIDNHIWPFNPTSKDSQTFCRDPTVAAGIIGLLWKMEMRGLMTEHSIIKKEWFMEKWTSIIPIVREKLTIHTFAFFDIHWAFSLTHVVDPKEVQSYVQNIDEHATRWKKNFSKEAWTVTLPLMSKGVISFCYGDMESAFQYLHKIRDNFHMIGGSQAQREPLNETYIRACMATRRFKIARDWIELSPKAKKNQGVCQYPLLLKQIEYALKMTKNRKTTVQRGR